MPTVLLGNHAALDDGKPISGKQVTTIIIPESDTHSEGFRTITHEDGIWPKVASEPATWVVSDDERLARRLGAHFDCPVITMEQAQEHLRVAQAALMSESITEADIHELLGPEGDVK